MGYIQRTLTGCMYIWRRDVYGKRIYADKRDIRRWNIYREGIHTYIYTRRRLGEYVRNRFRGEKIDQVDV